MLRIIEGMWMARTKKEKTLDANVTVRMPRDLYERLEAVANLDQRHIGEMARMILAECLPAVERRLAARADQEREELLKQ